MTKKDILNLVAAKAHMTRKTAREAIDTFLNEITKALNKREKVVISGFGTFKVTKVKDKPVVIPGSREKKMVKAHYAPRFTPGKPLRKTIK